MTNKQKWDIALQEYIHESDILEKSKSVIRLSLYQAFIR